jgi:hypothetical protein
MLEMGVLYKVQPFPRPHVAKVSYPPHVTAVVRHAAMQDSVVKDQAVACNIAQIL